MPSHTQIQTRHRPHSTSRQLLLMSTAHHSDNTIDGTPIPTLDDIASQHMTLSPWVARTPTFERHDFPTLEGTPINFKFELLQVGGTFKTRGAF